jgi:hypothetical protein
LDHKKIQDLPVFYKIHKYLYGLAEKNELLDITLSTTILLRVNKNFVVTDNKFEVQIKNLIVDGNYTEDSLNNTNVQFIPDVTMNKVILTYSPGSFNLNEVQNVKEIKVNGIIFNVEFFDIYAENFLRFSILSVKFENDNF